MIHHSLNESVVAAEKSGIEAPSLLERNCGVHRMLANAELTTKVTP